MSSSRSRPHPRPRAPVLARPRARARWAVGALLAGLSAGARLAAGPTPSIGPALLPPEARFLGATGLHRQQDRWDCGPAALRNLLERLGEPVASLDHLASRAGSDRKGTSLGGLSRAARSLGLPTRACRLDPGGPLPLRPFIAWLRPGHFVTVVPEPPGSLLVLDPALGRYRVSPTGFARIWSGEALIPGSALHSQPFPRRWTCDTPR